MQQQREALMKEKETAEKVAARAFAHSYLSDLVPAVFTSLSNKGFFYDPIQRSMQHLYSRQSHYFTNIIFNKLIICCIYPYRH